jgi:UDP:flavonoid glycosyltransferase YjiC (YdhE family)
MDQARLPNHLLFARELPHAWLFPRVLAVVHHGGAGTTGAGLQAGIPNLIVPFTADQGFWGRRIAELGVGSKPIPLRRLTVDRLAEALKIITSDAEMRARAYALGEKIRQEDGVGNAIEAIRAHID